MSLENAILEHASALRELAAAIKSSADRPIEVSAELVTAASQVDPSMAEPSKPTTTPVANVKMSATPVEFLGKTGATKPDAELETAVQKVEEAAAAEQPADLDYAKDVRPVLLAAIKKSGKPAIESLLAKFGVQKADQLQAKDFAAVLAEAQKLAA